MNAPFLTPLVLTGFLVAFFHAAIPTHWLPFVLAGRGQGWNRNKTLAVTGLAGLGHTVFTALLGILVVWLGMETNRWTGSLFPLLAGGVLILFGLYYISRHVHGTHGHHHGLGAGHAHGPTAILDGHHAHSGSASAAVIPARKADGAVIVGLLGVLTFSPCEGFLPIYLAGARHGWSGFALLSGILAAATVAGMIAFTSLTMASMKRLNLEALERYEGAIIGALLCLLGAAVIVFEP